MSFDFSAIVANSPFLLLPPSIFFPFFNFSLIEKSPHPQNSFSFCPFLNQRPSHFFFFFSFRSFSFPPVVRVFECPRAYLTRIFSCLSTLISVPLFLPRSPDASLLRERLPLFHWIFAENGDSLCCFLSLLSRLFPLHSTQPPLNPSRSHYFSLWPTPFRLSNGRS